MHFLLSLIFWFFFARIPRYAAPKRNSAHSRTRFSSTCHTRRQTLARNRKKLHMRVRIAEYRRIFDRERRLSVQSASMSSVGKSLEARWPFPRCREVERSRLLRKIYRNKDVMPGSWSNSLQAKFHVSVVLFIGRW